MKLIKASIHNLEHLTEMNIKLRSDEKIDNIMSDNEVRDRMRVFLTEDEYEAYLLTDDKLVYGYALINLKSNPKYLRQIFIKNKYRSKGIGSKFIEMLLKKLELDTLDVEVMVWNERAIKFYEEYGFKKRYLGLRYEKK